MFVLSNSPYKQIRNFLDTSHFFLAEKGIFQVKLATKAQALSVRSASLLHIVASGSIADAQELFNGRRADL